MNRYCRYPFAYISFITADNYYWHFHHVLLSRRMLFCIAKHMYSLPLQNNKQIVFPTLQQHEKRITQKTILEIHIYKCAAKIIEMQIIISYLHKTIIPKHVKYFLCFNTGCIYSKYSISH